MHTGTLEGAGAAEPRRASERLGLWMERLLRRLLPPPGTWHEDDMPDWIKRDIGWHDGPAERPRAELEGWRRQAPARRARTD